MRLCMKAKSLALLLFLLVISLLVYNLAKLIFISLRGLTDDELIYSRYPLPNSSHYHVSPIKMVHFMYKTYSIPLVYVKYLQSWRSVYPDYTLYFWTDADLMRLARDPATVTSLPWLADLLSWLPHRLMRSDLARLMVLHRFGGWYADLDVMCIRRADSLAGNFSLLVPLEPTVHALTVYGKSWVANNAVLYSAPGHPFLAYALDRIAASLAASERLRIMRSQPVHITGPGALTDLVGRYVAAHWPRCGRLDYNVAEWPISLDPWCPSLRPEEEFNPLFDSGGWTLHQYRILCSSDSPPQPQGGRKIARRSPTLPEQCRRQRRQNFANTDPGMRAYAYHAFLHRSETDMGGDGGGGRRGQDNRGKQQQQWRKEAARKGQQKQGSGGDVTEQEKPDDGRGRKVQHRMDIRQMSELRLHCGKRLLGDKLAAIADGC